MFMDEDISDCEPDFTDPQGCAHQLEESDGKNASASVPLLPHPRKYSKSDLNPTQKDPRCDPDWPLAVFWPVYLSNFKIDHFGEEVVEVSDYFASKGLLTRMIFIHSATDENALKESFRKAQICDMLVYFTCKQDAEDAIRFCHRERYQGHYLNVLSGREPDYVDKERSLRLQLLAKNCESRSEQLIEQFILKDFKVECITRHQVDSYVVQFIDTDTMIQAVHQSHRAKPIPLIGQVKKQRFIEHEVKALLLKRIETDPSFMDMKPKAEVLRDLLHGKLPKVDLSWQNVDGPVLGAVQTKRFKNSRRYLKLIRYNINHFRRLGLVREPNKNEIVVKRVAEIEEAKQWFLRSIAEI